MYFFAVAGFNTFRAGNCLPKNTILPLQTKQARILDVGGKIIYQCHVIRSDALHDTYNICLDS